MFLYQFSEAGTAHNAMGRGNEDALAVHRTGDMVFAFMADGMGSARLGAQAARSAVETAAALSPWTFVGSEGLGNAASEFAVRASFPIAYNALVNTAAKNGWDTREMLTTFMSVTFNGKTGRLDFGFCGDGGIVALTKDGKVRLLTRAVKGTRAGSTTPLHSVSDWRFGSCEGVRTFLMCTDGVFDVLFPQGSVPRDARLRKVVKRILKMPSRIESGQLGQVFDNAFSSQRQSVDDLGRLMDCVTDDRSVVVVSARKR